jgi:hypothetical protein
LPLVLTNGYEVCGLIGFSQNHCNALAKANGVFCIPFRWLKPTAIDTKLSPEEPLFILKIRYLQYEFRI